MNKKQLAAERMKQRFVKATIEIVGTSGLSNLTANLLSKKVGASKGGLYHHFENLGALKLAALQSLVDGLLDLDETSERYPSFDIFLNDLGEQVFSVMEQQPIEMKALMAFTQQAMFDPAFREGTQQLTSAMLARYAESIRHWFPSLTPDQVATLVQIIDTYFAGAMIHWFVLENPQQCRENWQQFCHFLCAQIDTSTP